MKHEADGRGKLKPGFSHIFLIPADGGTYRQISSGKFHHRGKLAFSRDGAQLYFSGNRNKDWEYDFRNSEIYSIDIASNKITQMTDRKGPDHSIAVAPVGKKVAYLGYDDKVQTYQVTRLYVMNPDGSDKKELKTGLDRSISSPVWSSDGRGLFYMYDDNGNTKIGYTTTNGKTTLVANNVGGTGIGRPYGGGSFSICKSQSKNCLHAHYALFILLN